MNKERMMNTLLKLCQTPSISETKDEAVMSQEIFDMLNEIEYFKDNSHYLYKIPIENDLNNRCFVAALMRGNPSSNRTVILLSHHDVVSVGDFGSLKQYAFDPVKYTELLKKQKHILSQDALADLDSNDYLFGRGTMDMKYGIALDIEILHHVWGNLEHFPGNVLFLSVPDEEANSAGMLAAVEFLHQLKQQEKLEYACCIVSEPYFPRYTGDQAKYIYAGTVGKLLPAFYCIGKETHAGDPFSGLNPNLLTAKIIAKLEQNPVLSEMDMGCTSPAPVCLKASDTKNEYSVQIPTSAYAYFNIITLNKTPKEVSIQLKVIAAEAFEEVISDIKEKAASWYTLTGDMIDLPEVSPLVLTYSELLELCVKEHGDKVKQHMDDYIKNSKTADVRELSIEIVIELCKFSPYKQPMIVMFYAPPYYPSCNGLKHYKIVEKICDDVIKRAKAEFNEELLLQPYFLGLSDMSYLGLPGDIDTSTLASNFPLWGNKYSIPLNLMSQLNIPFVNIGPSGKDAHKYTERLCISYSFDKAAKLILDTLYNIILDKI